MKSRVEGHDGHALSRAASAGGGDGACQLVSVFTNDALLHDVFAETLVHGGHTKTGRSKGGSSDEESDPDSETDGDNDGTEGTASKDSNHAFNDGGDGSSATLRSNVDRRHAYTSPTRGWDTLLVVTSGTASDSVGLGRPAGSCALPRPPPSPLEGRAASPGSNASADSDTSIYEIRHRRRCVVIEAQESKARAQLTHPSAQTVFALRGGRMRNKKWNPALAASTSFSSSTASQHLNLGVTRGSAGFVSRIGILSLFPMLESLEALEEAVLAGESKAKVRGAGVKRRVIDILLATLRPLPVPCFADVTAIMTHPYARGGGGNKLQQRARVLGRV